jgi:hypothetical protein
MQVRMKTMRESVHLQLGNAGAFAELFDRSRFEKPIALRKFLEVHGPNVITKNGKVHQRHRTRMPSPQARAP